MSTVNSLLQTFQTVADSPKAQMDKYIQSGKKVVGCVPVYTPGELVHAFGCVPFGVWGADTEIKDAKQYFPAFICSIMQSVLELGMRGTYDGMTALIIPSLCDSLKSLGENWKYAVPSIPFIPMTYPQNRQNEVGKTFVLENYKKVIAALEKATGTEFSDVQLGKSIEVYNRHNAAMRKLSTVFANNADLTVAQRNSVFKSAYFMEASEHTALVEELIELLEKNPMNSRKTSRVIVSGILADGKNLLEIFDHVGFQVVADDVAHQSRQYRTDAPTVGNSLENLADKFCNMDNCSVLFDVDKKRIDAIIQSAKEEKADAVIVLLTKFCDPEEFDYVLIKEACEKEGIPHVLIEVDRQMTNYQQAKTILETLKDMIS